MQIGSIAGGNHYYPPHEDSPQATYMQFLNAFRNNPSKKNADNLLQFLNDPANKTALEKIANKNPDQHQIPTFDVSYQSSISALKGWETSGKLDPNKAVIPEEFLNDIQNWINY